MDTTKGKPPRSETTEELDHHNTEQRIAFNLKKGEKKE